GRASPRPVLSDRRQEDHRLRSRQGQRAVVIPPRHLRPGIACPRASPARARVQVSFTGQLFSGGSARAAAVPTSRKVQLIRKVVERVSLEHAACFVGSFPLEEAARRSCSNVSSISPSNVASQCWF